MIIIVSHERDAHSIRVLEKARELGVEATLWDISKFPNESEISFSVYPSETKSVAVVSIDNRILGQKDISGVFWRRPHGAYEKKESVGMDEYVRLESDVAVKSLFEFFTDTNWISAPEPTRLASRKPVQLKIARSVGFRIPMTCISNSPDKVRTFIGDLGNRPLTMKPIGTAFMNLASDSTTDSSENKVVFTKITSKEVILKNIQMVKNCPVIFQEAVVKDYDVRATIVDNTVFAAEVTLDGCRDPANLDWRNYEGRRIYKRHTLPKPVELLCIELVYRLGLRFGCIDLAYSEKEGYTFFEINPQGQWLPSEELLGYDISGAVLQALLRQDGHSRWH